LVRQCRLIKETGVSLLHLVLSRVSADPFSWKNLWTDSRPCPCGLTNFQRFKTHAGARRATASRCSVPRLPSAKTAPGTLPPWTGSKSEADIGPDSESERAAISEASKKVCHSMIPHALALRSEIDKALAKLAETPGGPRHHRMQEAAFKRNGVRNTRLVQAAADSIPPPNDRPERLHVFKARRRFAARCEVNVRGFSNLSSW